MNRLFILWLFVFCKIALAQEDSFLPVPDRTAKRIIPEASGEYDAQLDHLRRSKLETERELEALRKENESLRARSPSERVTRSGFSPPETQGINERPAQRRRQKTSRPAPSVSYASGVQVFAVSEDVASDLTVLPAGSWARGTLITGAQANSRYGRPAVLQLDYAYTGPNGSMIPLQGCTVVVNAVADLSIEKVGMSAERISCVRENGEYVDRAIDAWVTDDDGDWAVAGTFDSKQDRVFLAAVLAGVVKGASQAYEIANTEQKLVETENGESVVATNFKGEFGKLALSKALGEPAGMVTQWYLEQAKALLPTVQFVSGQKAWVIMRQSVEVPDMRSEL